MRGNAWASATVSRVCQPQSIRHLGVRARARARVCVCVCTSSRTRDMHACIRIGLPFFFSPFLFFSFLLRALSLCLSLSLSLSSPSLTFFCRRRSAMVREKKEEEEERETMPMLVVLSVESLREANDRSVPEKLIAAWPDAGRPKCRPLICERSENVDGRAAARNARKKESRPVTAVGISGNRPAISAGSSSLLTSFLASGSRSSVS